MLEEENRGMMEDEDGEYGRKLSFSVETQRRGIRHSRAQTMEKLRIPILILVPIALLLFFLFLSYTSMDSLSSSTISGERALYRMRSELESISLLQKQEASLLRSLSLSSPSSSSPFMGQLRAEILSQLSLNREAQQALLYPHTNLTNGSESPDDASLVANGILHPSCKKALGPGGPSRSSKALRTLTWSADPDRFLLAFCTSGQFSNHLVCLEKHMIFAALLNRTLVLPSPDYDYDFAKVLNISHMQRCLDPTGSDSTRGDSASGNSAGSNSTSASSPVLTFDEFRTRSNGSLHIDRFLCYMHDCYLDAEHEEKLKKLGFSWGSKVDVWPNEASTKIPSHPDAAEIIKKFSSADHVIGIGDVFYADVEKELLKQPGGAFKHSCQSIIRPHRYIIASAQRFVQTYLGGSFIALHFRRYGFLTFCNENSKRGENCFYYPIPQAAKCISRVAEFSSTSVIYLSTDAQESETNLLKELTVRDGFNIPLIQRPIHNDGEKWDSILKRNGLLDDKEVMAMLDKMICALGSIFIGTPGSTFSDDIIRMRQELGTSNTCDEYLCHGEDPDFIAGSA